VKENYWLRISEELVMNIFGFLEQSDLGRACLVCRHWNRLAFDESLWRKMVVLGKRMSPEILMRAIIRNPRNLQVLDCELQKVKPLGPECYHITPQLPTTLGVRQLSLCTTRISDTDISKLILLMPKLLLLEFGGNKIGPETLAAIATCQKLTYLSLKMVEGIEKEGFDKMLAACTGLKVLDLAWTCILPNKEGTAIVREHVTAITASVARHCQALEELDISGNREFLTDAHVETLTSSCRKLKVLDLSDSYILTDAAVKSILLYLDDLEQIALSRCHRINIPSFRQLAMREKVKALQLFGCYQNLEEELKESKTPCEINNMALCQLEFKKYIKN
jgi:F-box and leucine-rich repeat protein 1 (S-phase kinase-associated protein 2)